jgi:hypothetical protein
MELSKQCCSLIQAKKLKELGLTQQTEFYFRGENIWYLREVTDWGNQEQFSELMESGYESSTIFSAYTVAELGVMLPCGYDTMQTTGDGWRGYDMDGKDAVEGVFKTEAECRAAILIHLLESGNLTHQECNTRIEKD